MGLFGKLLPSSPPAGFGGGGGRSSSSTNNEDPWIPVAIEFATNSQDDELLNDEQQHHHQDFNDSFFSNSTGSAGGLAAGAGVAEGGGGGGGSALAGAGGIAIMTGRGINSREISPPQPGMMNSTTMMPTRRVHDMVGTGINSRLSYTAAAAAQQSQSPLQKQYHNQQQYQQHQHQQRYHQEQYSQEQQYHHEHQQEPSQAQQARTDMSIPTTNPFLIDDVDGNNNNTNSKINNKINTKKKNPFNIEYDSSSSDDVDRGEQRSKMDTKKNKQRGNVESSSAGVSSSAERGGGGDEGIVGLQQFEDSMRQMEEKLKSIDSSKFIQFDHHTSTEDDDDDDDSSLETSSSGDNHRMDAKNISQTQKKSKPVAGGAKSLMKMFGKKKEKMRLRRQQQQQQEQVPRQYHRPVVDSDYSSSDNDDDDANSHISGQEEYYNSSKNVPNLHNNKSMVGGGGSSSGGIGVPNGKGSQLTPSQLEDELYRYKLETLNLTDACRDLLEQLEEVEGRLGTVQAQATFRIHALEAELQDNTLGLKSLVKMTSTEMDGRLEALRAVSKTMAVQAARLKERDAELTQLEQRVRKSQRDIQRLKRENKKVMDEKMYLKSRLDDLNQSKYQLEEDMKQLANENTARVAEFSAEEQLKIDDTKNKLHDALEELEYVKSELECKDRELIELVSAVEEKDGEVLKMMQELDIKGECRQFDERVPGINEDDCGIDCEMCV